MTYIQTKRNGWCYLSTIMDLHSRRIIGYSFSKKMDTNLVLKALESAVKNRTITGDLIIHTDLGSQYTSDDYNQRLTELHIRHSYSPHLFSSSILLIRPPRRPAPPCMPASYKRGAKTRSTIWNNPFQKPGVQSRSVICRLFSWVSRKSLFTCATTGDSKK